MSHDTDISWQTLREVVRQWAGNSAELAEVKPLVGGCINTTLSLRTAQGQRAVLKISPHRVDRRYVEECHQLGLLREVGLPVPEVYECRLASLEWPHSYLLMQFVEGTDLNSARRACDTEAFDGLQQHLAELVLRMHDRTNDTYHRCAPAEVKEHQSWAAFFHETYDGIWQEVDKSGLLPVKARKLIARVHQALDRLLAHGDRPRLTHWDLWATNLLCAQDGDGRWRVTAVIDPNCKFAHIEAEIAYLELFQTVTTGFMKRYQQDRRLSADYARLYRPIYQMYHLMNHVRLFGAEYVKPLLSALERVAPLA